MLTVHAMSEELGNTLRKARKLKGLTLKDVARELGVSYPAVQQWETGKTAPSTENLIKVSRLLDIDPLDPAIEAIEQSDLLVRDLLATKPQEDLAPRGDVSAPVDVPGQWRFVGPRDVPLLGTAVGGTEEDGDFRFNGQRVDYAPRPPGIATKKDVYALWVVNDSMSPKYEQGERIYVDPHRIPAVGDYVVLDLKSKIEGESGPGYIKRLAKRTPTKIVVKQFNPEKELEFDIREVKALHRVIPTDELLGL